MKIDRKAGWAPRTAAVAREMGDLEGPCVGCRDCRGLCPALIEAMTLPEIVLGRDARA
ncbi:hypothetical protein [Rhodosalinus halophilus]|jgi:ferredoxin|uniref:hypothetical protein n=1 Tax=Rhodosalinus halophilus TaxID=2259333 RepID=UPI0018F75890|nr:hypothetical protein [Rhodosalinus halophilus]